MFKDNQSKIKYADIIDLPHHVSARRSHMPVRDRAAQFAPFAALTGHDDAVRETARLTDDMIELDTDEIAVIDRQLQQIRSSIGTHPRVSVTYFVEDSRKDGGSYITEEGRVHNISESRKVIMMENGTEIPVKNILRINF